MIIIDYFNIDKENKNLYLSLYTESVEETITEINLYTSATYPDKDKSFPLIDLYNPDNIQITIPASYIGEYFFTDMYIIEIVVEKEDGSYYTQKGVFANMEKLYKCFIQGVVELKVENCELLTDSDCACVDDIIHSSITLDSLDILLKSKNIQLATELYLSLNDKCSLNCIGLEELENNINFKYATYKGDIILTNNFIKEND